MPARTPGGKEEQQAAEIQRLSARLEEAEETLRAIRAGEVDAPVVSSAHGEQVFTLSGANHSYRALVEEMNEGALSLRVDGVILHANRRFAAMLRAPLERVTGTNIGGWIAPESRQALSTLLKDGTSRQCRAELDLAALDGTDVPVYLSIYPLSLNGAGNTLGAVATDLTEKKKQQTKLVLAERAAREALQVAGQTRVALLEKIEDHRRSEQALRTSEARFRHIFETSPLGKVLVT
ncbi:MAG TPA: PAS domain S-box protein, partial [Anaerolineales bacterium]|nr:PAS domain S-box protein [Anaerolineales bacterium]